MPIAAAFTGNWQLTTGNSFFLFQHAENIALAQDHVLRPVDFNFRAAVFSVVHRIAHAQADLHWFAVVIQPARADGDDFALGWLFLRRVGKQDPALGFLLGVGLLDDYTILQGFQFHSSTILCSLAFVHSPLITGAFASRQ